MSAPLDNVVLAHAILNLSDDSKEVREYGIRKHREDFIWNTVHLFHGNPIFFFGFENLVSGRILFAWRCKFTFTAVNQLDMCFKGQKCSYLI